MANSACRDFNGTSSYLDSNSGSGTYDFTGTETFTVGCWAKSDTSTGNQGMVACGDATTGWLNFKAGVIPDMVYLGRSGYAPSYTISSGKWYFSVCAVTCGTNIVFYDIDETQVVLKETVSVVDAPNSTTADLTIGARSGPGIYWNGLICHVQIWTGIKTEAEILEAAIKPGSIVKDLQDYWPVWGASSTEPSLAGNQNHATLVGTGTTSQVTPYGIHIKG